MRSLLRPFIIFAVICIICGICFPEMGWLLIAMVTLSISFDAILSLIALFYYGKLSAEIVLLNFLQLPLFAILHSLIYWSVSADHYYVYTTPKWYDWLGLVSVHTFKAIDLLDIVEAFGYSFLNVENDSLLSGGILLTMNILMDVFLISAFFNLFSNDKRSKFEPEDKMFAVVMKRVQVAVFIGSCVVFFFLFMSYFMQDAFAADITNLVVWPLEQILRILDIGDAFQIFDYQMHTMPLSNGLVTTGIFFRASGCFFILRWLEHLYLWGFKGRGKTIEDLAEIVALPHYSTAERLTAVKALERFGEKSVCVAPIVGQVLVDFSSHRPLCDAVKSVFVAMGPEAIGPLVPLLQHEDAMVTLNVRETLEKIDPNWQKSKYAGEFSAELVCGLIAPNIHVRQVALETLKQIDENWFKRKEALEAVPFFVNSLKNPEAAIRTAAAEALKEAGVSARMAVFRLVKACVDQHGHVRAAARQALDAIDKEWMSSEPARNAVPFLIKNASHENKDISEASQDMLELMGEPANSCDDIVSMK